MPKWLATGRVRFFAVLLLLLVAGVLVSTVEAQDGDNYESYADYLYGQVMRFYLGATGDLSFKQATLFIQIPETSNTLTVEVPLVEGENVLAQHSLDLTRNQLPPFSTITYWWQLKDADGNLTDIPVQAIEYVDDQFVWQKLERDGVAVHWIGEDGNIGQAGLDAFEEGLPELQSIIPIDLAVPLRVYIYPTTNDLRAGMRLTGRDWVGAHAHPEIGVILVSASNPRTAATELEKSVPHELSHLLLYQATGSAYESVPRWFDEGLASLAESSPNSDYDALVEEAVNSGETIPFSELCRTFPPDSENTLLAYAQSASLIKYIQAEYGNRALSHMVATLAEGAECDNVIARSLGSSLDSLNEEWLLQQGPRPLLDRIWREGGILVVVVAAGFLLTGWFVLRMPRSSGR